MGQYYSSPVFACALPQDVGHPNAESNAWHPQPSRWHPNESFPVVEYHVEGYRSHQIRSQRSWREEDRRIKKRWDTSLLT